MQLTLEMQFLLYLEAIVQKIQIYIMEKFQV